MKNLLILLFVLIPSAVFAQHAFDVSCENVTKILIVKVDDQSYGMRTPQGFVYYMAMFLKPEAKKAFRKLVEVSQQIRTHSDNVAKYPHATLSVTANGKPLRNDAPEIHVHGSAKVGTIIIQEEDALATARSVCPTVPIELILPPNETRSRQKE